MRIKDELLDKHKLGQIEEWGRTHIVVRGRAMCAPSFRIKHHLTKEGTPSCKKCQKYQKWT